SGTGSNLRRMVEYGAPPSNLVGFDLLRGSLEQSRCRCPEIGVVQADGGEMPFRDATFDLILQFTVFSSLLEPANRRIFAKEMRRVLRPDGLILWCDFRLNNPWNPDVRGVTLAELRHLFPDCECLPRRTVLAPPLTRLLYPRWPRLCELLSWMPFL